MNRLINIALTTNLLCLVSFCVSDILTTVEQRKFYKKFKNLQKGENITNKCVGGIIAR